MDLLTGWVDCSTMFGATSPDYRVFRLRDKKNNNLNYFKYLMQCCYMCRIFYSLGQGVSNLGIWRLQAPAFNNFQIPVPPKEEQEQIAEYLEYKCMEINRIIDEKQEQVVTLEQYKKSLIYEYVTGKKKANTRNAMTANQCGTYIYKFSLMYRYIMLLELGLPSAELIPIIKVWIEDFNKRYGHLMLKK